MAWWGDWAVGCFKEDVSFALHDALPHPLLQVKKKDERGATAREEEERTVSVVSSLLGNIARQSRRDRVAAKFVEAEFEKCDRLMEVYFRCEGRVAAEEAR